MRSVRLVIGVGLAAGGVAALLSGSIAAERRATPASAVARNLPLLQQSAATWSQKRECSSCHHQSLGTMAVEVARERGFAVDAAMARGQIDFTLRSRDEAASVDTYLQGQGPINGQASLAYVLTGLAAVRQPAGRVSDTLAHYVAARQLPDGSLRSLSHRPPIEDSPVTITALAVRALLAYGPDRAEIPRRVTAARGWLERHDPDTTEERAMQLFGLLWAGAPVSSLKQRNQALLHTQRPDGGWSQIATRKSDAYATGQALVALNQSGLPADSPAYRRGVAYLLRTQQPDGSWRVPTRRKDELGSGLEYFETGFPHGRDQFISYAGTAWAVMALSLTRGSGRSPALTDTAAAPRDAAGDEGWTAGTTPLMKAALLGTVADVETLLASGADPNAANAEGSGALMWAATRSDPIVRILLERGADPNAHAASGFTPVMMAAGSAVDVAVLRRLIAGGASVNGSGRGGWTPLALAVKAGDPAKAQLLFDSGAAMPRDPEGASRLLTIAVAQEDAATLTWLLDSGLDPNAGTKEGETPLMIAVMDRLETPARTLLSRGADVNRRTAEGMTALMFAALADPGHSEILHMLLRSGADPDAVASDGVTARSLAAKHGHAHMVDALRGRPTRP